MRFLNEGDLDRAVRMLGGILVLSPGWGLPTGAAGIALVAVGAIALLTGLAGWCPAYTAFGVSTRNTSAQDCPNCDANNRV